jgi:hypothetical protein
MFGCVAVGGIIGSITTAELGMVPPMLVSVDDGRLLLDAWRALPAPLAVRLWLIALAVALCYGTAWLVGFLV